MKHTLVRPTFLSDRQYEKAISLIRDWNMIDQKIDQFINQVHNKNASFSFDYYYDEHHFGSDKGCWLIVTELCSVAGCDLSYIRENSKEATIKQAAFLTLQGRTPLVERPCGPCYREYIDM
ncbi:hypothetical protein ABHN11_13140 [Brevibacillus centrosporus]|jgi:hypothetical protein|uniref:hypothetical protein n=1 Tax=Brevibacillus centrosporus TaxID=54910 RepID=UPI003D253345